MSYSITAIDRTTLPAALLPIAKEHMRVDFTDDDASITRYIQWAISYLEIFWGQRIFSASVDWLPPIDAYSSRYQIPVQPVASFIVMSEAVDVSAEYALEMNGMISPVWLVHSDGTPFPDDAAVSLTAGFTDPDEIEPAALGGILRVGASLYEYRESISSISLDQIPFWMNDVLGGLWIPRA